jgi:hypothetical protein
MTKFLSLRKDDAMEVDVAVLPVLAAVVSVLAVPAVLRPPTVAGMSISASTSPCTGRNKKAGSRINCVQSYIPRSLLTRYVPAGQQRPCPPLCGRGLPASHTVCSWYNLGSRASLPWTMAVLAVVEVLAVPAALEVL